MNLLANLNRAMEWMEAHLMEDIDLAEAAHQAGCSEFQLVRMFPYLAGMGIAEYIRRRRMSRAACDLLLEDVSVLEVAARYGYESPTAFSRAFQAVHGASPSAVRAGTAAALTCPRLLFTLSVKGAEPMEYRIEKLKAFRAVGIADPETHWNIRGAGEAAAKFWEALGSRVHSILDLMDGSGPGGLMGVFVREGSDIGGYMAAVATQSPVPEGMRAIDVPAATYAVFDCEGPMPEAMPMLWHRIFSEWLPANSYEWADTPDLERYLTPVMASANARGEIWLPVRSAED